MGELNLIKKPEILFEKKLIIYGTGSAAMDFYFLIEKLRVYPVAFCDSNKSKKGTMFLDYPVLVPDELPELVNIKDYCIIICSNYVKDIIDILNKNEISLDMIFTKFTAILAIYYYVMNNSTYSCKFIEKRNLLIREIIKSQEESPFNGDFLLDSTRLLKMLSSNKPVILNFAPEKTGSSAVFDSVDKNKFISYHLHDFEHLFSSLQLKGNLDIWKECISILQYRPIKIISGVREPVSREISAFFQFLAVSDTFLLDYNYSFEDSIYLYLSGTVYKDTWNNNVYLKQGYNRYLLSNIKYGCEFDWFDLELKKYWNIDVYKEEFNQKQGYKIYKNKNVEVFVYQLEKLSTLEEELRQFIGQNDFTLHKVNINEGKNYYKLYRDTLDAIKLPKKFFDFYYSQNLYFQHFYSLEDIDNFRKKWECKLI